MLSTAAWIDDCFDYTPAAFISASGAPFLRLGRCRWPLLKLFLRHASCSNRGPKDSKLCGRPGFFARARMLFARPSRPLPCTQRPKT